MNKFPRVIHVVREEPSNDEPFLSVVTGGVLDLQYDGQEVAVYKLEKIGKVKIDKAFVERKRR